MKLSSDASIHRATFPVPAAVMRRHRLWAVFVCGQFVFSESIFGQQISFVFVGGASITPGLRTRRLPFNIDSRRYVDLETSPRSGLLIGPVVEISLRRAWSIEASAIRRAIKFRGTSDFPGALPYEGSAPTWQFPILVKRRFSVGRILNPFVAAGPSFRTVGLPAGTNPGRYGVAAATGVEWRAGSLTIAPALRYTRWASDRTMPLRPSLVNQVELVAALTYGTEPHLRRIAGRKVWFGLLAGIPLTRDLASSSDNGEPYTGENRRLANFRSAAGLMVEIPVAGTVSLEANGLYRRLHFLNAPEVVVTWQFPLLLKYAWSCTKWKPFVAVGPSFRAAGNLNGSNPSRTGLTAGTGLDIHLTPGLRLSPPVRYTRWSVDGPSRFSFPPRTKPDQIELLVGLSF